MVIVEDNQHPSDAGKERRGNSFMIPTGNQLLFLGMGISVPVTLVWQIQPGVLLHLL